MNCVLALQWTVLRIHSFVVQKVVTLSHISQPARIKVQIATKSRILTEVTALVSFLETLPAANQPPGRDAAQTVVTRR